MASGRSHFTLRAAIRASSAATVTLSCLSAMFMPTVNSSAIELLLRIDASVEALAAQHSDLDFDHVEPTCVLGGVVELQPSQNAPGFGGRKCLVQGAG